MTTPFQEYGIDEIVYLKTDQRFAAYRGLAFKIVKANYDHHRTEWKYTATARTTAGQNVVICPLISEDFEEKD